MSGRLRRGQSHRDGGTLRLLGVGLAQQVLGVVIAPCGKGDQGRLEEPDHVAEALRCAASGPQLVDVVAYADGTLQQGQYFRLACEKLLLLAGQAVELANALLQQPRSAGVASRLSFVVSWAQSIAFSMSSITE